MENNVVKQEKKWVPYIDLIECVAILLVVFYHSSTYFFTYQPELGFAFQYHIWAYLRGLLPSCVCLFFFANGFLLLNRPFDLKKHIIKTIRVIITTYVWATITTVCLFFIYGEPFSFKELIKTLWNWPSGWLNHLWFMAALVCVYIFFPLIKVAYDYHRKVFHYFWILVTIMVFGNSFINHAFTIGYSLGGAKTVMIQNWFRLWNPFGGFAAYAIVYFCLGGVAYNLIDRLEQIAAWKRNLIAVAVILVCNAIFFYEGMIYNRNTGGMWDMVCQEYDAIPTLINTLAISVLCFNYRGKLKFFRSVASNTLGIYFIHMILVYLIKPYLYKVHFFVTFGGCLLFAIAMVLVCWLISFVIKKIPGIKYLLY